MPPGDPASCSVALSVHREPRGAREPSREGREQWPGVQVCLSQPHSAPWASQGPFLGLSFPFLPGTPLGQMAPKVPATALSLSRRLQSWELEAPQPPSSRPMPWNSPAPGGASQQVSPSRKVPAAPRLGRVPQRGEHAAHSSRQTPQVTPAFALASVPKPCQLAINDSCAPPPSSGHLTFVPSSAAPSRAPRLSVGSTLPASRPSSLRPTRGKLQEKGSFPVMPQVARRRQPLLFAQAWPEAFFCTSLSESPLHTPSLKRGWWDEQTPRPGSWPGRGRDGKGGEGMKRAGGAGGGGEKGLWPPRENNAGKESEVTPAWRWGGRSGSGWEGRVYCQPQDCFPAPPSRQTAPRNFEPGVSSEIWQSRASGSSAFTTAIPRWS